MNILFTICGRAGSKGIKNKILKDFLGYPLPYYSLSAVDLFRKQNPNVQGDIVINTDSNKLINLLREHLTIDLDIIEREASLSLDNTPKIAVISQCLEIMQRRKSINYDMVVDLDITSPLRTSTDVRNLIEQKMKNESSDVVFSVTESRRNPYFNMVKKTSNGYERVIETSFNSRQEAPKVFDMNASLYAYSPAFLQSEKGIFEGNCDVIYMKDTGVLDLDHENDLELMQVIAEYLFNKYPDFRELKSNVVNIIR